jgi:hypothetical protein
MKGAHDASFARMSSQFIWGKAHYRQVVELLVIPGTLR